jgi:heme/copper-type cytochrome/quinol oxidase subunit 2
LSALRLLAIVLIVAGIAGLVLGAFTYTTATHEANVGPIALSVKEKKTVNIPLWAGIVAIAGGAAMLVVPRRALKRDST